ncbi:winged helix-turn-helix transcriptional regulator [Nonomuraea sp. MG754425]|uniref:GntR family transcriptional regulator n=1 Tax=Nonomuraea sp. MG754425 TaxID=2570319 RepID=UPI001F1A4002|nr:winged helix-turn-helix domain-containing protein [Nonomuraea sp. MG754425]MCF6467327.1 winged helix-turn-helix transcriptional regulator [Nonomuraea sp. MG754425]
MIQRRARTHRDAVYMKVAADLAADIKAGRLKPGDRLPTEVELGARFQIGRTTVRAAVEQLRGQGLVQTVPAKGTYVTGEKTTAPVPASRRLVEDLRDAITSGHLKPGDPLPPEQELMDTYGLAAITITIALRKLRQEGLIHHIPGRGRFAGPGPAREATGSRQTGH